MNRNASVHFPGACREALAYYETHLGGKIVNLHTDDQMFEQKLSRL